METRPFARACRPRVPFPGLGFPRMGRGLRGTCGVFEEASHVEMDANVESARLGAPAASHGWRGVLRWALSSYSRMRDSKGIESVLLHEVMHAVASSAPEPPRRARTVARYSPLRFGRAGIVLRSLPAPPRLHGECESSLPVPARRDGTLARAHAGSPRGEGIRTRRLPVPTAREGAGVSPFPWPRHRDGKCA